MNIPLSAIAPFEPVGIPMLVNKRATLDELIRRLNKLMDENAHKKQYILITPDNPFYEQLKGDS